MEIKQLFDSNKDIYRIIEKVITYSASQEQRLKAEISEYVVTESIEEQFEKLLGKMEAAMEAGGENEVGVWVSGFYGSGKSSFTKYLGLAFDESVTIDGAPFVFVKDWDNLAEALEGFGALEPFRLIPTEQFVAAMLGFLSPANRGGLMTAMLLLFVFMGVPAGYSSAFLHKSLKGTDWKKNIVLRRQLQKRANLGGLSQLSMRSNSSWMN